MPRSKEPQKDAPLRQFLVYALAITLIGPLSACDRDGLAENRKHADVGINYIVRGSGQPVVLVHGFSQSHEAWLQTPVFEDLKRAHRIIAVDLRGHGDSEKPHDPGAYGRNMEADLIELLDRLDINKAHFVGFSMGASVVGGLLVSNPDRVQTAMMASGFFTAWDPEEEEFAKFTEERGRTDERYPWEPDNQDFAALAAAIRGMQYATVSHEQIANIVTPTLIVFGSIEIDHMREAQKLQLDELPTSIEVLIIEGADHDSAKAAVLSDEFSRAVRRFITSHPIS